MLVRWTVAYRWGEEQGGEDAGVGGRGLGWLLCPARALHHERPLHQPQQLATLASEARNFTPPLPPAHPPPPARSRSLMCHLRPGEDLRAELKDTLKPEELEALLASAHRPNYVVQVRGGYCLPVSWWPPPDGCAMSLWMWHQPPCLPWLVPLCTGFPPLIAVHPCLHTPPPPGADRHPQDRAAAGGGDQQPRLHRLCARGRCLPDGREPDRVCGCDRRLRAHPAVRKGSIRKAVVR